MTEENQDLKTAEILHPLDKLGKYAVTGGPGRPKGLQNKYSLIKNDLLEIWQQENGKERLRELFIKGNKGDFIKILGMIISLLPKETEVETKGQQCPKIIFVTSEGKKT